ncbi:hypothetical protein [Nocardiopsis composta]|uniref:Choline-glycine betaine transporter n=1 Tax=Nocardiopsis composta TaxID=157465 RepID=A0A7W8VCL1_9ACTN|nr:hypothetical protein [Nocardiopsis composta]MBB5431048.1 choline-glycine betaine transporter [Nocardiopsis composta]
MGGTAMNLELTGQAELSRALAGSGEEGALIALFDHLPLPFLPLVIVCIAFFRELRKDASSSAHGRLP